MVGRREGRLDRERGTPLVDSWLMPPWKTKVALQQVFSRIPAGDRLNYVFQRHVTHGLPVSDDALRSTVDIAKQHVRSLEKRSPIPIADGRFYEFGGGWDLHIPQTLYCMGASRQIVIDIRALSKASLVFDVGRRLAALRDDEFLRVPAADDDAALDRYLGSMGIDYRAPCDARGTGLPDEGVEFITSTSTMEHISRSDLQLILAECHRILDSRGAISFVIDYKDHYSYFDPQISPYNFLRYDERQWRRFNPSLHHQNRLRHRDFLELFEAAGFKVTEEWVTRRNFRRPEATRTGWDRAGFRAVHRCRARRPGRPSAPHEDVQ